MMYFEWTHSRAPALVALLVLALLVMAVIGTIWE